MQHQNMYLPCHFSEFLTRVQFFSSSTMRWEKLKEAVGAAVKQSSDTRWSARWTTWVPLGDWNPHWLKGRHDRKMQSSCCCIRRWFWWRQATWRSRNCRLSNATLVDKSLEYCNLCHFFFNYCKTMVLKVGSLFRKAVLLVPICEFYK